MLYTLFAIQKLQDYFSRKLGLVDRVVEGVESEGLKCSVFDKEHVYLQLIIEKK